MRHALSVFAFLVLAFHARAEWYAIGRNDAKQTETIEGGELVSRLPVRKIDLHVTALILRKDTEDAGRFWLEATLQTQRGSGDGYLLVLGDVVLGEIKTRGDKWAIGFDSIELARRCFQHLRELHKLDEAHARDATKA
jgi:hypothetical protein